MNGTPDEFAVVVENLEKRFGSFVAVDRVSFRVRRGEVFGFLGPNGAGKSTTIRMLCGILAPSGGRGAVAGFDIRTQPEQIKANIGYMSQRFSLYQDLTVEENIDFYSGIYCIPAEKKQERKQWVVEMSGLTGHRNHLTATLSGGWKQRLALGCAILHEPPIVFLDEPTSGVDPISRRQFWDLIYELSNRGVTVFVTTHYMDEAEYCNRLGLIYRGGLIALGTPHELKVETAATMKEAMKGTEVAAGEMLDGSESLWRQPPPSPAESPAEASALPSLEDVFVARIEARDRADRPQEEVQR
jgi:ABC-2 type transport system ATP-binding protein